MTLLSNKQMKAANKMKYEGVIPKKQNDAEFIHHMQNANLAYINFVPVREKHKDWATSLEKWLKRKEK